MTGLPCAGMDRRRFMLISLSGSLAVPLVAEAQQTATTYRVGYLGSFPRAEERAPVLAALIDRLRRCASRFHRR